MVSNRPAGSARWWALGALSLSVLAVSLDGTVLSVALPTLAQAFHATETDLQWFLSGYLVVLAAAMLPAGALGDRIGRKPVLLGSLALFGIASAGCVLAGSSTEFIAARAVLGVGGAGVIVMALSSLTVLFSPEERPKAVGVWSAANFVALPVGPILGGWLLTHYWWGWVFLINVPVALTGLLAAVVLVPSSRPDRGRGLDLGGMVLASGGLVLLTYGCIQAGASGWTRPVTMACLACGVIALMAFATLERHVAARPGGQPLVDPELFGHRSFTVGVVLAAIGVMAMIGVLFTMPQYFQGVQGSDAVQSGVRLMPLIGGLVIGAVPADRIAERLGRKFTLTFGFLVLAAGLALGTTTTVSSAELFVGSWMALTGLGLGVVVATSTSAALADLDEQTSSIGSAVLQAVNKTGAPFGVAILGSVLLGSYQARIDLHSVPAALADTVRAGIFGGVGVAQRVSSAELLHSVRSAFTAGLSAALWVAAAISVAGAVVAWLAMPNSRPPAAPAYSDGEHLTV